MAARGTKLGAIREGESYPLEVFAERTGLGKAALRQARRASLKMTKIGRSKFISGRDWLEHLERNSEVLDD
jgi:hypothetical protein